MPGPNKQFDRDEALQRAMQVFWEKGYNATSIQDLVDAAGINRSSMYSTFGDKEALFLQSLEMYTDMHYAELRDALSGRAKPLTRLKRGMRRMFERVTAEEFNGCLAANTATELGVSHPDVARIVRAMLTRGIRAVRQVLDEAVEAGELDPATDTARLATFFVTFMQGAAVMHQAGNPNADIEALLEGVLSNVHSDAWRRR